jgi:hypothetical protein
MSFSVASGVLAAAVANTGTFTVAYPDGLTGGAFQGGVDHQLVVGQKLYKAPVDFTIAFGAAVATITWKGANPLAAGSAFRVQFDRTGSTDLPGTKRTAYAEIVNVELGEPIASNDASLRANAALAAGGAIALLAAGLVFDIPRNLILTSSGNDSGLTFTAVGKDEYGAVLSEAITGANIGVAAGKKAFKSITSITASGAAAANLKIGFGNVLGLPVHLPAVGSILQELQDGVAAAAGTKVAGLNPLTASTTTTADTRGTYVPNVAPDGTKAYSLILALRNPTFLGVPQA